MNWKVLLLLFILWFGLLGLTGTLFSGYHLTDDQDVLRIKQDVAQTSVSRETRIFLRDIFTAKMRFRPVHNLQRRLGTLVFGSNFTAWSVYFGILGVFAAFFLFRFARETGYSTLESGFFTALTLLGEQAAIWWKLGSNETPGMFFLSAALFCMAKSERAGTPRGKNLYEILFAVFTITASWCKESFILIIPALIAWKIWLTVQKDEKGDKTPSLYTAIKKNIITAIVLLAVFTAELINIIKVVGTTGIGYAGYDGFSLSSFFITGIRSFMAIHGWVIVVELLIIGILFHRRLGGNNLDEKQSSGREVSKHLVWLFLLTGLIVVPQIVLYMKSGMMERYLLPGIMGYTFLMVSLTRFLRETGEKSGTKKKFLKTFPGILVLALLILICLQQLRVTRYTALAFAREGKQVNAWFQSIRQYTQPNDMLVVIVHPLKNLEAAVAFKAYLEIEMNRTNVLYAPGNLDIKPTRDTFWNHLNREFFSQAPGFRLSNEKDREGIRGIMIFPGLENQFLSAAASWFKPGQYERYSNEAGYVGYYYKK